MIQINCTIRRTYFFPADRLTTFTYYSTLSRLLTFLPHICLVHPYSDTQFRMLYSTLELKAYRIRIFADIEASLDRGDWALRVTPLEGTLRVQPKAGVNWATSQGHFSSSHLFHEAGQETRVDYDLKLRATLPTPLGMRFMPGRTVDKIAESIAKWRMQEVSDGFVQRSIDAFPGWLEHRDDPNYRPQFEDGHGPLDPDCLQVE
jgi:hypothetical protein